MKYGAETAWEAVVTVLKNTLELAKVDVVLVTVDFHWVRTLCVNNLGVETLGLALPTYMCTQRNVSMRTLFTRNAQTQRQWTV